jgi:hypothetical protein
LTVDVNSSEDSRTEDSSRFIDPEKSDVNCRGEVITKLSDCEKPEVRARELDIPKKKQIRQIPNSMLAQMISQNQKIMEMQLCEPMTKTR